MRDDVKAFIECCVRVFEPAGPVLEIGSRQTHGQEGYADLRTLFPGRAYVGCDVEPGPGVDRIDDACALRAPDGGFGTVVAADSLEHVAAPWRAAAEMHRVLAPGGLCVVTAPFIFPVHHPPDYMRFTPEGLVVLLGPFARVAAFSLGCAQWPHTTCAVAVRDGGTVAAFDERVARLRAAWDAADRFETLLPAEALTSVVRRDTGDVQLDRIDHERSVAFTLDCPADGFCRATLKVDAAGDLAGRQVRCVVTDARDPARLLRDVSARARPPVRGRWIAFPMEPIADSGGRRLVFRFSSPVGSSGARVSVHTARGDGALSFEGFVRRRT
jgi:SAM-dependent methyltransferase